MKKFNLVGIILAALACLAYIFISIPEEGVGVTSIEVLGWLGILVSAAFIVFYVLEKKINRLLWLIPFILVAFISSFFEQTIVELGAIVTNGSMTESTDTMSLVIAAYYIVSLVFALSKKMKWAAISCIVFASLMIFDALTCIIAIVDLEQTLSMSYYVDIKVLYLIWPMLATMLLYSAQILFFVDMCSKHKNEKKEEVDMLLEEINVNNE